ncbi:MAG: hypothetical protein P8X54_10005, partial [Desulfuromonadales bacterium]
MTDSVTHVTVLALGGMGDVGCPLGLEFRVGCCPNISAISGKPELGKGSFHMEIGESRVVLGRQGAWGIAQVGQDRVGDIMTTGAEVLALMVTALKHGMSGTGISEAGP